MAETGLGPVTFTRPVAYQEIGGKRVEVACGYAILEFGFGNLDSFPYSASRIPKSTNSDLHNPKYAIQNPKSEYCFKVASYDTTKDLIIDPLLASTFLGGGNSDYGYGIAVDASNKIFVTGCTYDDTTVDLPTTTGAYNQTHTGFDDVFVSKFGTATYIELISFTGKAKNDGTITLTWETAAEIDNAGFNVYRARGKKGEFQRLNNALIPAKGSPMEGAVYEYTDTLDRPGVYYYQLEDIDTSGASAMHGPVRVMARMGRRR